MGNTLLVNSDVFSIATLIYTRLRRVSGRVVDALYLAENIEYARYVVHLMEVTQDPELLHLVDRLKTVMDLDEKSEIPEMIAEMETMITSEQPQANEPTEDDVYRSQVSHHYIGALR